MFKGTKLILLSAVSTVFLFTACQEKVVKVYVDENGTEVEKTNKKFKQIAINEFACDKDGYAYTVQRVASGAYTQTEIYIPFFRNHTHGLYQMKCKDLQ